jgi:hypothetical protein
MPSSKSEPERRRAGVALTRVFPLEPPMLCVVSGLHSYSRDSYPPSGGGRRFGIVVASVVALALAGYIGSVLGPHFKSTATSTTTPPTTLPLSSATSSTVVHSSVKVVVANGTQMANTAAHFTQVLQLQGWNLGSPQNSTSSASTTAIYYAPAKQPAAALIASELGAPASGVQPLGASTPVASTTGVDVVVVIGADLAANGFPATTAPS